VTVARTLNALLDSAVRRPRLTIALAVALAFGGAAFALRLRPTAAADTFVGRSSTGYQATQRFYRHFGEEPVAVLVKGELQQLVLSSDIERLLGLEGCLSGNVPAAALSKEGGVNGPCGRLARAHTVKVVFGPGTFLNEAASQIDSQLSTQGEQAKAQAKEAEQTVYRTALAKGLPTAQARELAQQASKITIGQYKVGLVKLGLQYGLDAAPSLADPNFVSRVVFDNTAKAGTPNPRFAYLFPSPEAALVSVRMKAGLSERQRTSTIALIRAAVAMPQWRMQHGETYLITGEPVIVADLTGSISHSLELLLVAVLLVMAATLSLIFRGRPRLAPLAVAMLAAALTFGGLAIAGASLTMASIAVLPVLVGLSVDYAIQFQSRVEESLAESSAGGASAAVRRAAAVGAPTIATAGAASAGGLLVLLLSPVPMVRGFGALLMVGIALAFVCALSVGSAAFVLAARRRETGHCYYRPHRLGGRRSSARARSFLDVRLGAAWRGARELLLDNPLTRFVSSAALGYAVRRPARVLGIGLALAVLGWGLDTQTRVQTDITKLVPQNLASLRNLNALERLSGVGGEIDLMVSSKNLAKPSTIEWMSSYESAVLKRFHYTRTHGCGQARLCPAFSLPDLFQSQPSAATTPAGATPGAATKPKQAKLTQAEVSGLLNAIPPYFSQDVITPDRRVATLAFGIRLMPLDEQQHVIDQMRAALHPPAGVDAELVGLPVLAAQANAQVVSPWRRALTLLAGLAAVALVLLIAFRGDRRRALAPLIPIALATGWSALILFAVRVPLNPMSVTLSALVIAISTEFSVLLSERHRQERLAGYGTGEALRRSYRHTGAAVAASGVTAIAGFGVLALSDIRMLRDFGLVTLIDLSVSLVGVLVALPAALLLGGAPVEDGGRDEPAGLPARSSADAAGMAAHMPSLARLLAGAKRRRAGTRHHEPA
jgi:uncharacterized protein